MGTIVSFLAGGTNNEPWPQYEGQRHPLQGSAAGAQSESIPGYNTSNEAFNAEPSEPRKVVVVGQPTGWAALYNVIREFDEEKIRDCKEDIDTLLVFAGLFSGVVAGFVFISYNFLFPYIESRNLAALRQLTLQSSSYTVQGNTINSTTTAATDDFTPFQPSPTDVAINALWFASLLISLMVSSFAILVKQWLREYLAVQNPSPQARLRVRHLRNPQLEIWLVYEIAATLPLLEQTALALFFVGMYFFSAQLHPILARVALPIIAVWAFCFITVTFLPLIFPRCPYRTSLLKSLFNQFHRLFGKLAQRAAATLQSKHVGDDALGHSNNLSGRSWSYLRQALERLTTSYIESDETLVVQQEGKDLEILAAADAIQSNDELLTSTIATAARQVSVDSGNPISMTTFVQQILTNRMHLASDPNRHDALALIIDLRKTSLSPRAQKAVMDTVALYYQSQSPLVREVLPFDNLQGDTEHQPREGAGPVGTSPPDNDRLEPFLRATFILALMLSLSGRPVENIVLLSKVLSSSHMARHIYRTLFQLNTSSWKDIPSSNLLNGLWYLRRYIPPSVKPLQLVSLIRTGTAPSLTPVEPSSTLQLMDQARKIVLSSPCALSSSDKVEISIFLLRHLQDSTENRRRPAQYSIEELVVASLCHFRHEINTEDAHRIIPLWRAALIGLLRDGSPVSSTEALATAVVYGISRSDALLFLRRESVAWTNKGTSTSGRHPNVAARWKSVVSRQITSSASLLNNIVINLRLLLFSIHLTIVIYEQSGQLDTPSTEWMGVFDILADQLRTFVDDVQNSDSWRRELQAPEITYFATVCLEVLRHEEIVARLYQNLQNQDRSDEKLSEMPGHLEVVQMVKDWDAPDHDPTATRYIFPRKLIEGLKTFTQSHPHARPTLLAIPEPGQIDLGRLHARCICCGLLCQRSETES